MLCVGVSFIKKWEKELLLRHVPSAITRTETVGVLPVELVYALLHCNFHAVGTLLGDDAAQGVGDERAHLIVGRLQLLLIAFVFRTCRAYEERKGFRVAQLPGDDGADVEVRFVNVELRSLVI